MKKSIRRKRNKLMAMAAKPNLHRFNRLFLCHCTSFNQYRVNNTKLFTIIGELHHMALDHKRIIDECKGNFMIDDYIRVVNDESLKNGKKLTVFIELSPVDLLVSHQSNNLWRIEQFNHWLVSQGQSPIEYERVDIRRVKKGPNLFLDRIYNPNEYDNITLKMLEDEQKNDSYVLGTLMDLLNKLLEKEEMYEPIHLEMLGGMFLKILEEINNILPLLEPLMNSHSKKTTVQEIIDQNDADSVIINEIVQKYIYVFTSVVDLYAFIQVFRNDKKADHIIYLVGEKHAYFMKKEFENASVKQNVHYHLYEGQPDMNDDVLIDVSGSFY